MRDPVKLGFAHAEAAVDDEVFTPFGWQRQVDGVVLGVRQESLARRVGMVVEAEPPDRPAKLPRAIYVAAPPPGTTGVEGAAPRGPFHSGGVNTGGEVGIGSGNWARARCVGLMILL